MSLEQEIRISHSSKRSELFRPPIRKIGSVLMPVEITGEKQLERSEELLKAGYGLSILFNHFSLRDPVQIAITIAGANSVMRHRRFVSPIAKHQYEHFKPILHLLSYAADIKFCPVVTNMLKNTNGDLKAKQTKLALQMQFADNALGVLRNGGIVTIAPQTTRMESLKLPEELAGEKNAPPIGTLVFALKYKKIENVAFLLVGVGIKGAKNYRKSEVGKFNLDKIYTLNIGPTFTMQQLLQRAGGNFRSIDKIIFGELEKIVPLAYRSNIKV